MKIMKMVFLAIFIAAGFLSCSRGGSQNASTSTSGGGGGTLDLWSMFTGADGVTFSQMVEAYNATNPTFRVNHMPIEAGDLYLRLQLAVASGSGIPDIAVNHIERIPLFQEEGRILNLAPYLAQSPIRKERYNQKAWSMTEIAGGHYGIPLDIHSYILYVNWDLYTQYGLTDLDDGVLTWDELRQTAQRLLASGDGIIPIGLGWLRPIFLASYAQLGGTLSEDGTNPSFNNAISQRVVAHYADLIRSGYTHRLGEDPWRIFMGGQMLYMPREYGCLMM